MAVTESLDTRLRATEFLIAYLFSKTRSREELQGDRDDLKKIVDQGDAWKLMLEISSLQASEVVEAAVNLLDEALFQQGSDRENFSSGKR
jgi:hypothetical protein